jgi:hypothetical protein
METTNGVYYKVKAHEVIAEKKRAGRAPEAYGRLMNPL